TARGSSRREIFAQVWLLAEQTGAGSPRPLPPPVEAPARVTIPHLTEPWYC
ncbi:MAG: CUAEP/CCAEP-tail radical SAM (seleno)protein, partial [Candidatus Methylomirabilales bacterium]